MAFSSSFFSRTRPIGIVLAALAVWLMTPPYQRAEHRDTQAIHAKLDELLHAQARAYDEIADENVGCPLWVLVV
jgi:low affinity Fe/Cu permease